MNTDPLADRAEMHVPTTDEVRINTVADLNGSDPLTAERLGQFDRWLAAHAAQVRADERERIAAAIEALPGPGEVGIKGWPEHDQEIYLLAIEEAATAARTFGGER